MCVGSVTGRRLERRPRDDGINQRPRLRTHQRHIRSCVSDHVESEPTDSDIIQLSRVRNRQPSSGCKGDGPSSADAISELIGLTIPVLCLVGNMQAISALKNGYSKRLRCLSRTHRCSIGALNEIYIDPEVGMDVQYHTTKHTRVTCSLS